MENSKINSSLLSVIGESGGKDLLEEASEITLDHLIDIEVLKDIPVVGSVRNLLKIATNINGYFFTKKLQRFLIHLAEIPIERRQSFKAKLDRDKNFREKVSENLLILIDKLDDMLKPELLARAFSAYIMEEIDYVTFRRISVAIDRCFVEDLPQLLEKDKRIALKPHVASILLSAGLIDIETIPTVKAEGVMNIYEVSDFGKTFIKILKLKKGFMGEGPD